MDEQELSAATAVVAAIEAFWGASAMKGRLKSSITRCAPVRGGLVAAPFVDHEREEFDERGRLVERLRYDDDGVLYRRERVVYPFDGRLIRFSVEPLDGGAPFEWRYLPDGPRIWASRIEADGTETAIWSYALDAAGRIVECVQEDGRGRFFSRHAARYDGAGRLVELISEEEESPAVQHLFEYGPAYRKIAWEGGPAGNYQRVERYDKVDGNGNWLGMTESTYRNGVELGVPTRYERELGYCI